MPRSSGSSVLTSINFYSEETIPSTMVGSYAMSQDGKGFRYTLAGGTTLVSGDLQQASADDTQFNHMAVQAAAAAGATQISVTLGSTLTTVDLFKDGVLSVDAGASMLGQVFRIVTNTAAAGAATCVFTIDEPLKVALTTSAFVTVRRSPWSGVIIQPTTHTAAAAGGAVFPVTNAKYGWLQTKGVGACLSDATVTAAATMGLSPSVTTAGCVTLHVNQDQVVGRSLVAVNVSARVYPMLWQID